MPSSSFRNSELFILGAGSSVPAELPASQELITRVRDRLTNSYKSEFDRLKLKANEEQKNSINFESIFWELEKEFDTEVAEKKFPLVRLRSVLVEEIKSILWQEGYNERLAYFEKFCKYVAQGITPVVTLNWENTVETAFRHFCPDINLDIGLVREKDRPVFRARFCSENSQSVKIVKVHGSLNLSVQARTFEYFEEENQGPIYFLDGNGPPSPRRNIVLGSNKKPKIEKDQFLTICWNEYKQLLLSGPERINFVGYSFQDDHINSLFESCKSAIESSFITVVNGEGRLNNNAEGLLNGLHVKTVQGTSNYFDSLL